MSLPVLYVIMVFGGVLIEIILLKIYYYLIQHHLRKNHFIVGRYLFLLSIPLLATLTIYDLKGESVAKIFLVFASIGPIFEWLVGYSYYQVVGTRLWTYHTLTYQGHSSLLTIPLWGMTGVFFWLVSQKLS